MKEALYARYAATITFTDDDLLLGTAEDNRPLYVTGMIERERISRILIDPGSSALPHVEKANEQDSTERRVPLRELDSKKSTNSFNHVLCDDSFSSLNPAGFSTSFTGAVYSDAA